VRVIVERQSNIRLTSTIAISVELIIRHCFR
jgi:hypothetical protein